MLSRDVTDHVFPPHHELFVDDLRRIITIRVDMDTFLDDSVCAATVRISYAAGRITSCETYPVPRVLPVRYLQGTVFAADGFPLMSVAW